MKKRNLIRVTGLWLVGAALFGLRLIQLRTGFDPDTGLALPSLAGSLVWAGLLASLAVDACLCLHRGGSGKRSYPCCFHAPEGSGVGLLAAGSFLLIAGGALLVVRAMPFQGTAAVTSAIAGLLGAASGAGLLLLTKELRSGGTPTVFPLLPAMFFSVLFLLSVYFPEESNPVLGRFYVPVLAAAMAAYFFYQLSGFFRSEGSLRWFDLTGSFTAVTCITAAADSLHSPERLLVYLGFAVTATVFLLLLREEPLPEPEEPSEDAPEEAAG